MATVKIKFKPPKIVGSEGTILYQISHEKKTRLISSGYRIYPSEWDCMNSSENRGISSERRIILRKVKESVRFDMERFARIIRNLESSDLTYKAEDVAANYLGYLREATFFVYTTRIMRSLQENGKIRTAETYISALSCFRKFRKGEDILLDRITPELIGQFEAWLREKKLAPNTISFYNRVLRAVYKRAVEEGMTVDRIPFRRVYTGVERTVKRAIPLASVRKIKNLNLKGYPHLEYARDIFILSFMLRGMSFIDMAFLRKKDLSGGKIVYRRRKTGQRLSICWTKEMEEILSRYPTNETQYLLPIICRKVEDERKEFLNISSRVNRSLKTIASMAGLSASITLYVARHSWASAAQSKGIPISVISEGMGHDSESTTRIYLASLDTSDVDRANALILRALK